MRVQAILWVLMLVSLALAIASRKYRTFGLVVVALGIVTIVTFIGLIKKNETAVPPSSSVAVPRSKRIDFEQSHVDKLDKADPDAKNRIGVSEIRFDQVRPSADSEPGTFDSIHARLYNDSGRFTLTDYAYYLVVQDCLENVCTTIYDQRGLASALVPPNQARDVKIEIAAPESRESPRFKILGASKVILTPAGTRAYKADLIP